MFPSQWHFLSTFEKGREGEGGEQKSSSCDTLFKVGFKIWRDLQ